MTVLGWHGAHDARIWKSHLRTRVPVTTGQSWLSGCAALEHPMMDVQEKRDHGSLYLVIVRSVLTIVCKSSVKLSKSSFS